MNRIAFGVIAVIASFVLAESLTCNKCSVGLVGLCIIPSEEVCGNTSVCYTGKATFPDISGFLGFNTQGCLESSGCNQTTSGSILGATFTVTHDCCSTDKCNPIQVSSDAPTHLPLGLALIAALVVSVWGCLDF